MSDLAEEITQDRYTLLSHSSIALLGRIIGFVSVVIAQATAANCVTSST